MIKTTAIITKKVIDIIGHIFKLLHPPVIPEYNIGAI